MKSQFWRDLSTICGSPVSKDLFDTFIIGDTAYDADHYVEDMRCKGCKSVIPPRKNRKQSREYDTHMYAERHTIECFFGKIKHFRRIFSRFDKSARSYLAFLHIVGALIWFR